MIKKRLSIVIPCFNEEENIERTHKKLTEVISQITKNYEIIFIENGSNDKSLEILSLIVKKDPHIVVVSYSRNFGPYGAYAGGFMYATGDAIVCIDADLQDPPELIPQMVEKWQEGFDVVYGIRSKRKGNALRKNFVKLYYRIMSKLSYVKIPLDAGDFSLIDRKVIDVINKMPEHKRYIGGLRAWAGFKQYGISYERKDRKFGSTKFNFVKYLSFAVENIFSFSYKPLELIYYLAVAIVGLTALGIVAYFLLFLFYADIPRGFITLILVILFLGGVQLLCFSIIAQYLAQIFEEVKNRPHYIVKEVLRSKSKTNRRINANK